MGLKVFYSERIEDLAFHLKLRLLAERSVADAFAFSQVVVPNANIAKWLRVRAFADAPALCAGVEFPFIEQALQRAMNEALAQSDRAELLPMNAYANGVMAILLGERAASLEPFYRYVSGADGAIDYRKAWQLSVRLSDLIDQYEVRRTDIVANWLSGKGAKGAGYADETEAAEAELVRRLLGAGGLYPPEGRRLSLRQLYDRVEAIIPGGPRTGGRTFRFFGLSTLTPLQVRIFRWLAKGADVEVYHNNVCLEYWGDIEPEKRARSLREKCRTVASDDDFEIENPLLREWGTAGRETMRLLALLEEEGSEDIAFEWSDVSLSREEPSSVLGAVQRGICRRTGRLARLAQDASLQVVAAPGIRREVEMVHNAIIGLVMRGDCGDFSDVAVLVTDMRRYKPMLRAVFDGRGVIPYGLVDTSVSGESDCLDAFEALMALVRKGLTRETLFAVLANPCLQRALGYSADDVRSWRRMADEAGAFERFEDDGAFGNFSWEAGLARLRLGFIADDSPGCAVCQSADESALKFSEVVERLYRRLGALTGKTATCTEWAATLCGVIGEFIDAGDDAGEAGVRRTICETLDSLAQIPGEHPLALSATAVAELVGGMKAGRSGYLTRGVTIASLQPMRPVPFRTVFILGMGEGDFPGRESSTTLDMRGAKRGLGDASVPAQNRYLFLETFMAVRDRLVISYPSMDMQKDAELFPSGLVGELKAFVSSAILPDGKEFHEIPLPLLERGEDGDCPLANPVGPVSFDGYWAGVIPTYSHDVRRLAMRIASGARRAAPCGSQRADMPVDGLSPRELAAFVADPLQGVLRGVHGIPLDYGSAGQEDGEIPLELPEAGIDKWRFDEAVLGSEAQTGEDALSGVVANVYDDFAAHGSAPARGGFFGDYSFRRMSAVYAGEEGEGFLRIAKAFAAAMDSGDETASCAVVLRNSEDGPGGKKPTAWPPLATIEPLFKWLVRIAEDDDDEPRSLDVGIIDFRNFVCAKWRWEGMTPDGAREAVAAIRRRIALYAVEPPRDGLCLRLGYRLLTNALVALRMPALPESGDENGWRDLADAFSEPFGGGAFAGLAIQATKEALERLPAADDWQALRDFCCDVDAVVLNGRRVVS